MASVRHIIGSLGLKSNTIGQNTNQKLKIRGSIYTQMPESNSQRPKISLLPKGYSSKINYYDPNSYVRNQNLRLLPIFEFCLIWGIFTKGFFYTGSGLLSLPHPTMGSAKNEYMSHFTR